MKKFYLFIIIPVFLFLLLNACTWQTSAKPQLKENVKLTDIVNSIKKEIGIAMPMDINDITLTELFHIQKEDIIEYAGLFSISSTNADNFIIVKVPNDKLAVVKKALEQRRQDVIDSFKNEMPDEYNKAKASKIIQKGDYLIYICVGVAENNSYDKYLNNAVTIIDTYFK